MIGKDEFMKTDRLYAITVYLLNHGRTSARKLSERFEVSVRTIQRDIDALCCAGIPVTAYPGAVGGYEIAEGFRFERQAATRDDYAYIKTALYGLATATDDRRIMQTLEKLSAVENGENTGLVLDFSVLREGDAAKLGLLRDAVRDKHAMRFTYTNNDRETRVHTVEPVAAVYRWYAWYLLAYSIERQDYRLYKLVRMENLQRIEQTFSTVHAPAGEILNRLDEQDSRVYTSITVRCKASAKARVAEYLKGRAVEEYADGSVRMELSVVENEQFWFGALLSLGDEIEVLEPAHIRQHVTEAAEKILALYKS